MKYRVESGGHDIPEETIRRRYLRSRHNFWYTYRDLADGWYLFDNSRKLAELVANNIDNKLSIVNQEYFKFFKSSLTEEK